MLLLAAAIYAVAFLGFAYAGASVLLLAILFALARRSRSAVRPSVFVAAVQTFANLAASAVAGLLWKAVSPEAALLYLAGWSILAAIAFAASMRRRG